MGIVVRPIIVCRETISHWCLQLGRYLIVESNAITVWMASELLEEVMSLAPQLCTVR